MTVRKIPTLDSGNLIFDKFMPARLASGAVAPLVASVVPDANLPARLGATQLSATIDGKITATAAPWRGARPGNRIAVLSDSTGRGVYTGDSEPGIDGNTTFVSADSWITWAQALSAGRVHRSRNASIIGNTIAQMDARVSVDVIGAPVKPATCIVVSGYNDAYGNVTPTAYMVSLRSIVGKLRAAGIVPIIGTPLPTQNNATIANLLVQYSLNIRKYCADEGIILLDFQTWGMDPATGGLSAAVGTGGDGVHPSAAGHKFLGQKVADVLSPQLPLNTSSLMVSALDASNLAPNGKFTGAPTAGVAPNVFSFGAAVTGATPSVVTDALVPGSMQRVACVATGAERAYAQRVTTGYVVGDVLEFSGVITTAGGQKGYIGIDFNAPPYAQRFEVNQDVTRGYYCGRMVVPAGTPTFIDVKIVAAANAGSGTIDFGQLTVRNLTALGLA